MSVVFTNNRAEGEVLCQLVARYSAGQLAKYFYFIHAAIAFACTWLLATDEHSSAIPQFLLAVEMVMLLAKIFPAQIGATCSVTSNKSPPFYVISEGGFNFGLISLCSVLALKGSGCGAIVSPAIVVLCALALGFYGTLIREVNISGK